MYLGKPGSTCLNGGELGIRQPPSGIMLSIESKISGANITRGVEFLVGEKLIFLSSQFFSDLTSSTRLVEVKDMKLNE